MSEAAASAVQGRLLRVVPALDSLRRYGLREARADLVAGVTVAAIAVPQAMAYAMVTGLPAEYGLYTAIVMTAVGAVFDSSKQLINGPTNAISIAVLSAIAPVPPEEKVEAAILLAFLVGAIQLGITLLRLGDLTRYISHSVIVGFMVVMAWLVASLGLERDGVAVVGEIPAKLPAFAPPAPDAERMRQLSTGALAIAVLGLLEAVSMAKAIAAQTRQKLDMNQQCLSEGLANFTGSFFQCMPGSGSLTRSAINQQAGAASQWSGVISAAAVAAIMLAFAPYARFLPRAALAGILVVSAWKMVDWKALA